MPKPDEWTTTGKVWGYMSRLKQKSNDNKAPLLPLVIRRFKHVKRNTVITAYRKWCDYYRFEYRNYNNARINIAKLKEALDYIKSNRD